MLSKRKQLWDEYVTNEWRDTLQTRMTKLEQCLIEINSVLSFWNVKCSHESSAEPTNKEISFSEIITAVIRSIQQNGASTAMCREYY